MNYKEVYSFNVIEEIQAGKYVYMLDRETRKVVCVNEMEVERFTDVLNSENKRGRFVFWFEEKKENKYE